MAEPRGVPTAEPIRRGEGGAHRRQARPLAYTERRELPPRVDARRPPTPGAAGRQVSPMPAVSRPACVWAVGPGRPAEAELGLAGAVRGGHAR